MTRTEFIKQAQTERYAWARKVDLRAVTAFEARTKEQRGK